MATHLHSIEHGKPMYCRSTLARPCKLRNVAACLAGAGRRFVQTPSVQRHLRNLARAVLLRRHPILLQGPTSTGKTSLVAYLAAQTGHHFVRINNHQQTDLQASRSRSAVTASLIVLVYAAMIACHAATRNAVHIRWPGLPDRVCFVCPWLTVVTASRST